MRAHYLQHVSFETLGSIETWLEKSGYEICSTRCDLSPQFPDPKEIDLLIILGGPMSVNDEFNYPWLADEKKFIREMIDSGKPVLGICLGAQLIANVMGSDVHSNQSREIGWWPIEAVNKESDKAFVFPNTLKVFHWHGETFDLPPRAIHLARGKACENQAFQLGPNVIGLQFHLETLPQIASDLVRQCQRELVPADYVQAENEILSADVSSYFDMNVVMDKLLKYLTRNLES